MNTLESLRFPIGKFDHGQSYSIDQLRQSIDHLAKLPIRLTELVGKWGDDRLDTPYRPEGWTVRQLIHHLADSHMNAYIRTKLALTENNPTISPYDEGEWAKLPDSQLTIAPSLVILRNLHERWVTILNGLSEESFARTYFHPGAKRTFTLGDVVALYEWHGEHHYQHIYRLADQEGWL